MKTFTLLIGCALMLAQPVLAQPVNTLMIPRDSDGIVISVLHPVDYMYRDVTGGVMYTMGGVKVEFTTTSGGVADSMAGSTDAGPTAMVGSVTYKVEVSGNTVYLRDPATGEIFATQRVAALSGTNGLQVNPNGFAME